MTTVCIIQARTTSQRFPRKVLEDIAGKPMVQHVLERAQRISGIDVVVMAVPGGLASLPLMKIAAKVGVPVYQDSEHDVLERFHNAASFCHADVVVRITADCPLLDPQVCEKVIRALHYAHADYASNVEPRTYPQGLDCEAFTMKALAAAHELATDPYDREHVTPFLKRHELRRANAEGEVDLSHHRWVVDYPEDLEFIRRLYAHGDPSSLEATLAILARHPELEAVNAIRNS